MDIYKHYRQEVYPKVKHLRGTTRALSLLERYGKLSFEQINENQTDSITDLEWDNLIILDACRFDLYKQVAEEEVDYRYSVAGRTRDFIKRTFNEEEKFNDTVLVAGNPYYHPENPHYTDFEDLTGLDPNQVFHEVFHTYQTDWSEENETILPEPLIRDTKTASDLFEDKNLIVHFMQPHFPFIKSDIGGRGNERDYNHDEMYEKTVWGKAESGEYSRDEVWKSYKSNLEVVFSKARMLAKKLPGKTIITSDHGNLVGEKGFYGHDMRTRGTKAKALRKVPFEIYDE